jgi:hypothetical protein
MLDFIPLNKKASVYRITDTLDSWGKPSKELLYTGKCLIEYNTDLTTISGEDGKTTSMSASVVFHGLVTAKNGDFVKFKTALGVEDEYEVKDVSYFED